MSSFSSDIEDASEILRKQPLLREVEGSAIISGDLHGDIDALETILDIREELSAENLILLGDYVDRGEHQVEVISKIVEQIHVDNDFIPLRGNHEDIRVCTRYGFTSILKQKNLSEKPFFSFFSNLPFVAISNDVYMAHGGIPISSDFDLDYINKIERVMNITNGYEFEIVWNDPIFDKSKVHNKALKSVRGPNAYFWGIPTTNQFLDSHNKKIIIRAHTYLENGYQFLHKDQVLSVFSSKAGPYHRVDRKIAFMHDLNDVDTIEIIDLENKK